jgi:hypothetical protein
LLAIIVKYGRKRGIVVGLDVDVDCAQRGRANVQNALLNTSALWWLKSHGENNILVFVGHKLGVYIAHVHPLRIAGRA